MRFGLFLNTSASWPAGVRFDTSLAMAAAADRLGFDVIMVPQHYADTSQRLLQPLPLLGRLTAVVTRARLGTGIMLAGLLNPYEVAEGLATIDVMSGGRALLGVGAGHQPAELSRFGVARRERGRRLEECITAVRQLWGMPCYPPMAADLPPISLPPVAAGGIPIWVAGTSDAGVRRAARIGDAWYAGPGTNLTALQRQAGVYRDELARLGRAGPDCQPVRRDVFLTTTREQRAELPVVLRRRYAAQQASAYQDDLPAADRAARADLTAVDDGWTGLIGHEVIAGGLDECRDQMADLATRVGREPLVVIRVAWPTISPAAVLEQLDALGELVARAGAENRRGRQD
jgi:alkanesulfonate monooxygenase SsuD/methylene tetrahydromethanopterin reductase-like flavin-dependent oxidoreductase (luciferase family)